MQYKCLKTFYLEKVNGDGFTLDDEYLTVPEGSIWQLPEEVDYRFLGGEVRLESDGIGWIEITKENFHECFVNLEEPKLIETWDELKEYTESETHTLRIEDCCGFLHSKTDRWDFHYLSTHTFYGGNYQHSTELLQKCGFNVRLANWDE